MKKLLKPTFLIAIITFLSMNIVRAQVPAPDFWIDAYYYNYNDVEFTIPGSPSSTILNLGNPNSGPLTPLTAPPPSVPGSSITFSVSTIFSATLTAGGPPSPVQAPAQVTLMVTFDHSVGQTNYYETEMLQMSIQGGTLPSGIMIRESPTLQSTGQRSVTDLGTGTYMIDSFFDVFFEVSIDGGQTWIPSNNGPSHSTIQPNTSIPTMGTWGLIALSGLVLGFGIFFLKNRMI